ncbi:hypothetical protein C0991_010991, partial [Blastosporella zonata]
MNLMADLHGQTFGEGVDHPLQRRSNQNVTLEASSVAFVQQRLGVDSSTISFKSGFLGEVSKHAYMKQSHVSRDASIASSTPSVSLSEAIAKAEEFLSGIYNGHPASLQYLAKSDGSAALTHAIQIQNETAITFYEAFIDAHSGELLHITDFVAQASYLVLPITKEILTQGFETVVDPQDPLASPKGWHTVGSTVY